MNVDAEALARRLGAVRERIRRAAERAGRDPAGIRLVAVSKRQPVEAIRAAMAAGQLDFGENLAQELRDKSLVLAAAEPPIRWHYLGRVQTNKVRYLKGTAELVHGLSALRQADAFARRPGPPQPVLVQVEMTGLPGRNGVPEGDALALCEQLVGHPGVVLRGLMTIPPPVEHPEDAAPWFRRLAELAARGRDRGLPLHELSMGMSHDFETAIACGATIVRVGTAIFGPRPPNARGA